MTDGTTTWEFTYDANGMRTSRTDGTTTYDYIYNGSSLVQMTVTSESGSDTLYFTSDTVIYNGTTYYYVKNLQGDVTAILNSVGYPVVRYEYNAWGYVLVTADTDDVALALINPIRYRGYVYDEESGFYYLQSRYYDPEMGRFLNCDVVYDYDAGLQGFDLFLYCGNNPVNRIDISGANSEDLDGDGKDEPHQDQGGGNGSPSGGNGTGGSGQAGTASNWSSPSGSSGGKFSDYSGNSGRTEIHHIVEQCQGNKSGFSNEQIQASSNKVELDYYVHRRISGYYSSKQPFTNGLRVRDWLAGQSFESQTAFGWSIVDMYYTQLIG